jgi:hypothetical protein
MNGEQIQEKEMDKIFNRKEELIKRDHVYESLVDTFNKVREDRKNHDLIMQYRIDDPICDEIENLYYSPNCSERDTKEHQDKYPLHWKLLSLKNELAYKWLVNVGLDFSTGEISLTPYGNDDVILVGSAPVIKGHEGIVISDFNKYPQIYWTPHPNPFDKKPILADINEFTTPGYNKMGQKYLPILINVSRLNKNDAKHIGKELSKIIDSYVQKGQSKKPLFEREECKFLYGLRDEETFKNYLRWYDLHIRDWIPLRLIAHGEKLGPENKEAFDNRIRQKKVKWGKAESGEDRVQKGVQAIYKAIHGITNKKKKVYAEPDRMADSKKIEWKCSKHGDMYKEKCKECEAIYERYDRMYLSREYSMDRSYEQPEEEGSIDAIAYTIAGRFPRKHKEKDEEETELFDNPSNKLFD